MARDYYDILGISRAAAPEEITEAYRKATKLYHPDVSQEPFAVNIYKKMTEIYEVLMDPERRRAYDEELDAGGDVRQPPAPSAPPSPPFPEAPVAFSGESRSDADAIRFHAEQYRQKAQSTRTFQDFLMRPTVAIAVAGSILAVDILILLFGVRRGTGETMGYLLSSTSMGLIAWMFYGGIRYYTSNVFVSLVYSILSAIGYSSIIVRVFFIPSLYRGSPILRSVATQVGIHFMIFYVVFFSASQVLEDGGWGSLVDRARGRGKRQEL